MSEKTIIKNFKKYQNAPEKQADYLRWFEKIMVYRTTKTENPETTFGMVKKVFSKTAKNYGR